MKRLKGQKQLGMSILLMNCGNNKRVGGKKISPNVYYEWNVSTNTIKVRSFPTELNLPPTKSVFYAMAPPLVCSMGILLASICIFDKMFLVKAHTFIFICFLQSKCSRNRKEMVDRLLLHIIWNLVSSSFLKALVFTEWSLFPRSWNLNIFFSVNTF